MSAVERTGIADIIRSSVDRVVETLNTFKIRYQSTDYNFSCVRQFTHNNSRKERKSDFRFTSPEKRNIRLTGLQLIFDDKPTAEYRPKVSITINKIPIFTTFYLVDTENPFLNTDIDIDFGTGRTFKQSDVLEIFIWRDGGDQDDKRSTVSISLGEY